MRSGGPLYRTANSRRPHFSIEAILEVTVFLQELEKLVSKVVGFAPPPGSGTKKINILLMGGVGSGKSSLVSSLDGIFEGRISR
jgi:predicted GTPase